ncbi:hypothetical protein MLD38_023452 [Melastoma candidum]|uniref:Uncharacterized protein n=1 Tax=Melastoma candidum TaxID=119954 RepID=A0ACB9NRX6_9MYRT|nr:hypothetical protein MLD38_023452 [Melastoma candidum]
MEDNRSMTYDEASMERSKSFIHALQEIKNLRPQLYSAADYCEKSYLNSDQKQMVLDNLKDYAVRALVNTVDHLGTVAYKLTDLLEQQTFDVTLMELQVTSLNQQLLTCRTYADKEGVRQQQLLAIIPRHHKRYILPNSVNKKVHFSPQIHSDATQSHYPAKVRSQTSGTPAAKTLSWHLASETKSTSKVPRQSEERKPEVFRLLDNDNDTRRKVAPGHTQVGHGVSPFGAATPSLSAAGRDSFEGSKPLTTFKSFDNTNRRAIIRAPPRSRSMISSFFVRRR